MQTEIKEESTEVKETTMTVDELLGAPGAESVMTPEEKKPSVLQSPEMDMSFLNDQIQEGPQEEETPAAGEGGEGGEGGQGEGGEGAPAADATGLEQPGGTEEGAPAPEGGEDPNKKKAGRPTNLVSITKALIEDKTLIGFDDDKKIEDYNAEDFVELIKTNIAENKRKLDETVRGEFFQALPPQLQQAYTYYAKGGQDLTGMFRALAQSNEVKNVNIESEEGQRYAIRSYLTATNYGSAEEIEDEINSFADRGDLQKKAEQFKPKLDAMQEQIVQQKIQQQEESNRQRAEQSQIYMQSMYDTLNKPELNGIPLDNQIQHKLFAGLTNANYESINGQQTNLLGHLLEKNQWVEPNHGLIAEVLWHLSDPEGYKEAVSKQAKRDTHSEVHRKLKTESQSKGASAHVEEEVEDSGRSTKQPTVSRPGKTFFSPIEHK